MKRIKVFSLFLFLTLTTSCKYTSSPSIALAKEVCSCLFVAEQSEEYCLSITEESRILADYEFDRDEKRVMAWGNNYVAFAHRDKNPRFGCIISSVELDPSQMSDGLPGYEL